MKEISQNSNVSQYWKKHAVYIFSYNILIYFVNSEELQLVKTLNRNLYYDLTRIIKLKTYDKGIQINN